MIGIVVPVYNRPEYLERSMNSLKKSDLSRCKVLIVDDGSYDPDTYRILSEVKNFGFNVVSKKHTGVGHTLRFGFDELNKTCDVLMNLDSDTLVKENWVESLMILFEKFSDDIISGFNDCLAPHYEKEETYCLKEGIGGVNMLFNPKIYGIYVRPSLRYNIGWDWRVVKEIRRVRKKLVVTTPSVIQHIGLKSSITRKDTLSKALDYE